VSTRTRHQPVKLTKTHVDQADPQSKAQYFLRDTELKGFALRVTPNGAKSFIVEKRINGRVRRITLGRYGELTVEQARKQAQITLGDIAAGKDPVAEKATERARGVTLGEAFTEFLRARRHLKPRTVYDYKRFMEVVFKDWQARPLVNISKDMITRHHSRLGQDHGPAYANHAMRCLSAVFSFARARYESTEGESLIPLNPVTRLTETKAWYPLKRRRSVIKTEQLSAWYQAAQAVKTDPSLTSAETVADYLILMLFTGLRRQEAARLRWIDVDFRDRTMQVLETKNDQPLVLPLSDFVLELLVSRYARKVSTFVFPGTGKAGHLHEPRRVMAKITELSAVPFIIHDLRRTFITAAERLDISAYAIKRLVNHKMGGDVTAGYIVNDVERLRAPMQQITDALAAAMGIKTGTKIVPFPTTMNR
jgi:integrase